MFLRFIHKKQAIATEFTQMSDEALIASYKQAADNAILAELFDRYTPLIFGVCMNYLKNEEDSKDAVMQVFEDLHKKLLEHEIKKFKSWIYSVAKNHCLMKLRKQKSISKVKIGYLEEMQYEVMETNGEFHQNRVNGKEEQLIKMEKGIQLLGQEQRKCIELLYLQNKSYKEVAALTGFNLKNVKSHIQNGKRNLRNYLEKQ